VYWIRHLFVDAEEE